MNSWYSLISLVPAAKMTLELPGAVDTRWSWAQQYLHDYLWQLMQIISKLSNIKLDLNQICCIKDQFNRIHRTREVWGYWLKQLLNIYLFCVFIISDTRPTTITWVDGYINVYAALLSSIYVNQCLRKCCRKNKIKSETFFFGCTNKQFIHTCNCVTTNIITTILL